MATTRRHDVKDLKLAPEGLRRIMWADRQMPVLTAIRERFEAEQPLAGYRISACLHVTTETANLMRTLKAGGADVVLCASNPLSTQDDAAAALVDEFDISVFAIKGEDNDTYYQHIEAAVDHKPQLTMDDGADVIGVLHSARREQLGDIIAGMEETTTGVIRLKAMEADGRARVPGDRRQRRAHEALLRQPLRHRPVDDRRDHPRDERPARRQALRGRGLRLGRARRRDAGARDGLARDRHRGRSDAGARGADGRLRGHADGREAAAIGDIFCTATGDKHVISREHLEAMKDGTILCNTGHFNVEIDIPALRSLAVETREARQFVEEFTLADGRRLYLLAEGRLVNISAAEGHPAIVMDMSFANQALATEYAVQHAASLERKVYPVPREIDEEIARLKLATMGVTIDQLTEEQAKYLASWDEGT